MKDVSIAVQVSAFCKALADGTTYKKAVRKHDIPANWRSAWWQKGLIVSKINPRLSEEGAEAKMITMAEALKKEPAPRPTKRHYVARKARRKIVEVTQKEGRKIVDSIFERRLEAVSKIKAGQRELAQLNKLAASLSKFKM